MHIAVKPIARALEALQKIYLLNNKEDARELNRPLLWLKGCKGEKSIPSNKQRELPIPVQQA